jgi:hypothetical protein
MKDHGGYRKTGASACQPFCRQPIVIFMTKSWVDMAGLDRANMRNQARTP